MIKVIFATFLLSTASTFCSAALEFAGYMQSAKDARFVVTDAEKDESSSWLIIGDTFNGYVLVGYDRQNEILSVRKGDTTLNLPLKGTRMKVANDRTMLEALAAKLNPSGVVKIGERVLLIMAGKRYDAGARFTLSDDKTKETYDLELVGIRGWAFTLRYRGEEFTRPLK